MAQPRGRFERIDGVVVAIAPERLGHARIKASVWEALKYAIAAAGVACEALPDGVAVEVDDKTDFEPDALVICGNRPADDLTAAPNPLIVVEVLSPGSTSTDTGAKLAGYFRVPTIRHYLTLNAEQHEVVHHKRNAVGTIHTQIITNGNIYLDPPGLTLQIEQIYGNQVR